MNIKLTNRDSGNSIFVDTESSFGAKLAFISGSYDDVSACVVEANIRARYALTSRGALITGVNYLSADVEIKRSNSIRDIRYGFDGAYLGLDFNF